MKRTFIDTGVLIAAARGQFDRSKRVLKGDRLLRYLCLSTLLSCKI
jgi:hypothetical protein